MKNNILHYAVEAISIVAITFITVAYMTVGYCETPIILGAIGAIGVIAGYDIYKRNKE